MRKLSLPMGRRLHRYGSLASCERQPLETDLEGERQRSV